MAKKDAFGGHDDSGAGGIAATAAKLALLATFLLGLFGVAAKIFPVAIHGLSNLMPSSGPVPGADLTPFAANPAQVAAQTNTAAGQIFAAKDAALTGGRGAVGASLEGPVFAPPGPA